MCGLTPCVTVEYWEPAWLVETVKQPGTVTLEILSPILTAALHAFGVPPIGGGGAANASGSPGTNLHYSEAHVWAWPQLLGGPCTSCAPSATGFGLHYASEVDPVWRTATASPSALNALIQLGVWARLYPRGGKVIHGSPPVASGVQAARALDIAHQPIATPPNVEAHPVIQPSPATSICMQLASPHQRPCFPAGTPPVTWESGAVSPKGSYIWIFWVKKTCCVNPAQATCGITLPAVGGSGQNFCPFQQLPTTAPSVP